MNDLSDNFINTFENLSIDDINFQESLNIFVCARQINKVKEYKEGIRYINAVGILMDNELKKSITIDNINYNKYYDSLKKKDIIKIDSKKFNKININFIYLKKLIKFKTDLSWRVYFNFYTLFNKKTKNIMKEVLNNNMNRHIDNKIEIYDDDNLKYRITNKLIYKNIKKNYNILKKFF